jgi:hypothetical protein
VIVGKPGSTTSEFLNHILALAATISLAVFHHDLTLSPAVVVGIGAALNIAASIYSIARSYLKGKTHAAIADYVANRYVHLYSNAADDATKILDAVDGVVTVFETKPSSKVPPQTTVADVPDVAVPTETVSEAQDATHREAAVPA